LQYEYALESTKHWLVEVLETPLWVVRQNVEEKAIDLVKHFPDDAIAQFFSDRSNGTKALFPLPNPVREVIPA